MARRGAANRAVATSCLKAFLRRRVMPASPMFFAAWVLTMLHDWKQALFVQAAMALRSLLAISLWGALSAASTPQVFQSAALELDEVIIRSYAYMDTLPGGVLPQSAILDAERDAVSDEDALLRYAERRIASLADHHAITGSSFPDSWAVIPTYADLWIEIRYGRFVVDAIRDNSPAKAAGVKAGDWLIAVDGIATATAVHRFWADLGLPVTAQRSTFAARVLAAGRRDRNRVLTIGSADGKKRVLTLPSLYWSADRFDALTITHEDNRTTIRFNNSLGDAATVAAFDAAMAEIPANRELVLDLRETPSGGNTTVARAVMGWFVNQPTGYQVHSRPEEGRLTGVERQWVEQVLPRGKKYRSRLPTIMVGRWTGSMGEGIAIGFAAMGAVVRGTPMAGLRGSVEDLSIGQTQLSVKIPTERLMTVEYQPREEFKPFPEQ